MSQDVTNFLKSKKIKYIISGSKIKNKKVFDFLKKKMKKDKKFIVAFNEAENETVSLCNLSNNPKKEKITFSNSFKPNYKNHYRNENLPPLFFEYKTFYNGCDLFNKCLDSKYFPCSSKRSHAGGDILANWNYLFTSILLNTYHIYLDLDYDNRKQINFKNFCVMLSEELIKYIIIEKDSLNKYISMIRNSVFF